MGKKKSSLTSKKKKMELAVLTNIPYSGNQYSEILRLIFGPRKNNLGLGIPVVGKYNNKSHILTLSWAT